MIYSPTPLKLVLLVSCMLGIAGCLAFIVKRATDARIAKESMDAIEAEKREREISRRADELYERLLREVSG